MKKSFILFLLLLVAYGASAQHYAVKQNDYNQVKISFTSGKITPQTVKAADGVYTQITMEDYGLSTREGYPQLPVMSKLIEIPVCDSVVAQVINSEYEEYDAADLGITAPIYPVQHAYPKSYKGERAFTKNAEVYSLNSFYSEPIVRVEKSGTMRDVTMACIMVSPVAYNPVTNRIRIYSEIDVAVSPVNADIPATYELKCKLGSPLFKLASDAVINPITDTRTEFTASPIKYLIVANSMFSGNENLNNFVQWKKRLGYLVEVAYTSDANVGTTTTSIKNYILSHYNNATPENPAPTFLLLIGDVDQLPAFDSEVSSGNHVTDLYYATWTSGDNLPDCYYGRFSARNISELTPQIEKSLMYEQYTMPDPSYLGTAILIAGTDSYWSPTHAQGQVNYIYNNYINTTSVNHNYTTVLKHDYDCSSQAATIRSEISAGAGWINYTAHGAEQEWYSPSFTVSQISSLSNAGKYGLMIGNCCLTGKFDDDNCFGEALMRASNKGALAYIGGSNVTYWDEDVYWAVGVRSSINANMTYSSSHLGAYDRIFHTHGESHDKWSTTIGGYMEGGNLAVQSSSSSRKKYYWEIYHTFGDPSIRPYLGIPNTMTLSCTDVMTIGETSLTVTGAPAYAYVALTHDNEFVAAAFADAAGEATLSFDAINEPGQYELAVGAQNYVQYFKTISVIVPEGPYITASNVQLNGIAEVGTTVNWNLTVKNLGVSAASSVYAKMTATAQGVTLLQDSVFIGNLAVDETKTIQNAFRSAISGTIEDDTPLPFNVTVSWGTGSSEKNVSETAAAPKLVVAANRISPNIVAAGSEVTVEVDSKNAGHAVMQFAIADLTSNYTGARVVSPSYYMYLLQPDQTTTNTFTVKIADNVPDNAIIPLYYHTVAGIKHVIDTIYMLVGTCTEDFETGDFSTRFAWDNTSAYPWTVTTAQKHSGNYSVRSKENLAHNKTSRLELTATSLMDGDFTFYRKVSSETNYDKFKFYVDNEQKDEASGVVSWTKITVPVTAGTHTYRFDYVKDGSQSSNSDCVWVDDIVIPGLGTMVDADTTDGVGIADDVATETDVRLYPNPATTSIAVESNEPIQEIVVADMSGRLVRTAAAGGETKCVVAVSDLADGFYFITVKSASKESTLKFIKQ